MTPLKTSWIFLLLLWTVGLYAQRFPVALSVHAPVTAPGTLQSLGQEPGGLMLTMVLLDAAETSVQVRLRLSIQSSEVQLTSNEGFIGPAIILDYNVPTILTGIDMAPLLRPENFIIQGIDQQTFLSQGGQLPEGLYTICAEVVDFRRPDAIISDQICGMTMLDELAVPWIVNPAPDELIEVTNTSIPLTLQWQIDPGALRAPIGYNLYLYEMDQQAEAFGIGPAFYNQRPFFETEILPSMLPDVIWQYGINGELNPLELGQRYLMRVQAVGTNSKPVFS